MGQTDDMINFQIGNIIEEKKIIKVIGVGGGGGNAVAYIHSTGLQGVTYLLLNTDRQDLQKTKMKEIHVIGASLTKGLGAGSTIDIGEQAAIESSEEIREYLDDGHTEMVFVCAGMGGGTGTGAAPVIAKIARDMGLLTIGFIFMPFGRELRNRMLTAAKGAEKMREAVDSLVIINNEKINEVYGQLEWKVALDKGNEILGNAVRAITLVITREQLMNQDFADVRTTLRNGGTAQIGIGYGEGEHRVSKAIESALNNPLLNHNDITTATRLQLVVFFSSSHPLTTEEMDEIRNLTVSIRDLENNKMGHAIDDELEEKVKIVLIASGFNTDRQHALTNQDPEIQAKAQAQWKTENALLSSYYKDFDLAPPSTLPTFAPIVLTDDELDRDNLIKYLDETPALQHSYVEFDQLRIQFKYRNQAPEVSRTLDTQKSKQTSIFASSSTTETRKSTQQPTEEENISVSSDQPTIIKF